MITDEQARAALGEILETQTGRVRTVIDWARQELSRREQHDDGPITAEWCRENGADRVVMLRRWSWLAGGCSVSWREDDGIVTVAGASPFTRRQLLALLAALRGDLANA